MRTKTAISLVAAVATIGLFAGCAGDSEPAGPAGTPSAGITGVGSTPTAADDASLDPAGSPTPPPSTQLPTGSTVQSQPGPSAPVGGDPCTGPPNAGNPHGAAVAPRGAGAADVSRPTHVIGNGSPSSCTSEAVVAAVAAGGVITFDCWAAPVTITMTATAKVVNGNGPNIVLDGGGKVTLSGGGRLRIL
nr:hypothetical protein [Micromonospora sp. DSM 115978]